MNTVRLNFNVKNSYDKPVLSPLGVQPVVVFDGRTQFVNFGATPPNEVKSNGIMRSFSVNGSLNISRVFDKYYLQFNKQSSMTVNNPPTSQEKDDGYVMSLVFRVTKMDSFDADPSNRLISIGSDTSNRFFINTGVDGVFAQAGGFPVLREKVSDRDTAWQVVTVYLNGSNSFILNGLNSRSANLNNISRRQYVININSNKLLEFNIANFSIFDGDFTVEQIEEHHRNLLSQYSNILV